MGDLQFCYRQSNGVVAEDRLLQSSSSSSSNPDSVSIREDNWVIAEQAAQEVVSCTQPTLASDQKRRDVIEYVQRLIRGCLGLEVFAYGSVPLKTFLPDGDIDLTALGNANADDVLARDVLAVLQAEEHNENAEYEVKDTQFIDAEVKLVKCLVQNIVIDISFNQLGGLCTLCFLEQVDRLVGKEHLFKRSIILIKAWCYYESRILGAHHGLISTYALETLVLYIFHLFHSSLNGPLAVLYRFLDYFGKFDWVNYCISLNGPVCKSSLPDIVVELPENCRNDLMLSEEFLRNCMHIFSVPSKGLETNSRPFPPKHLNIIDPLKENNNLGRSVHKGNFYRIRSAFKFGSRKLGQILLLPSERIADEIKKFFASTLGRHGSKCGSETFSEDEMRLKSSNHDFDSTASRLEGKHTNVLRNELVRYSRMLSATGCLANGFAVSGYPLDGDVSSRIAKDTFGCSPLDSNFCSSFSGQFYYAPHFYLSGSITENGKFENGDLYQNKPATFLDEKVAPDRSCTNDYEVLSSSGSAISTSDANILEKFSLDFRETGDLESLNPLLELSGDYDNHIRSLLYGLCCHGYALSAPVMPNPPPPTSQFRNKKPWETVRRSLPLKQNLYSQMNSNSVVLAQPFYPGNNLTSPPSVAFGSEEKPKIRGTGTYFPNMNGSSLREKPSQRKARNQAQGQNGHLQRQFRNNGSAPALHKTNLCEEGNHELPHPKSPVKGHGKSGSPRRSIDPVSGNSYGNNGFSISPEKLEFGSFGHLAEEISNLAEGISCSVVTAPKVASLEMQSSKPVSDNDQERAVEQSYRLKNEDDFPPLSV